MFENKNIRGIYATRYIASWVREGGSLATGEDIDNFREWLLSINLTDDEVEDIIYLATNGKLELEISAKKFLSKLEN